MRRGMSDEGMGFPTIYDSEGPEEFSWEVQLTGEQTLEQVDDQHAEVRWGGGETAFTITATPAHDATGANVPTTLVVTEPNIVTLTVHHRAGNPAAGGAPFVYPINQGSGWKGGFATVAVEMPPPTEQSIAPPPLRCIVPDLGGRTVRASLRQLRRANCALGEVRGERSKGARVVRQFRKPGRSLPVGTAVDVKVLPGQYSRSS